LSVGLCSRQYLMMILCKGDHQPLQQPHDIIKEHKDSNLHFSNLTRGHTPFMVKQDSHHKCLAIKCMYVWHMDVCLFPRNLPIAHRANKTAGEEGGLLFKFPCQINEDTTSEWNCAY
jgi:hypothetical protein